MEKKAPFPGRFTANATGKKKKPRFFCDGCGTEVTADAECCPCCGKYFASIRCPRCGYSGDKSTFDKGCPACGYSAPSSRPRRPKNDPHTAEGIVPQWVYAVSAAFLVMLLAVLLMYIVR
ncbi:MAG: zinc ribbon domain-containing protein [Spirochaetaceae bacterium]|nr:zinc ribbon domain-containing protein [Spirochaetaceae bacterium]